MKRRVIWFKGKDPEIDVSDKIYLIVRHSMTSLRSQRRFLQQSIAFHYRVCFKDTQEHEGGIGSCLGCSTVSPDPSSCVSSGTETWDRKTQFTIQNELIDRKWRISNAKASNYAHESSNNENLSGIPVEMIRNPKLMWAVKIWAHYIIILWEIKRIKYK